MKNELLPAADPSHPMTQMASMDLITISPEKYTAAVYLPFKTKFAQLVEQIRTVEYDIQTTAGYKTAIACRAWFRDLRIATDKERKVRKAPIIQIGKLLESGCDEVIAQITPLEWFFDADIEIEDTRKAQIKQAEVAAEMARVAALETRLNQMRNAPLAVAGLPSAQIHDHLVALEAIVIDETFEEYMVDAGEIKAAALTKIQGAYTAALHQEEVAAQLLRDQQALEQERQRLKELQAETDRINAEALAKAKAEAAAALAVEQEKTRQATAAAAAEAARLKKIDDDAKEAARIKQEQADRELLELRAQLAALQPKPAAAPVADPVPAVAETLVIAAAPMIEIAIVAPAAPAAPTRPTDTEIIMAVADHFEVSAEIAQQWINEVTTATV